MSATIELEKRAYYAQRVNDAAVKDFLARYEENRCVLYREHLRCRVRYASPLLIAAMRAEGHDPLSLIGRMVPPTEWPLQDLAASSPRRPPRMSRSAVRIPALAGGFVHALAHGGALLRRPSHPMGACGAWITGDSLSARVDLGSASLMIVGGDAWLHLPRGTPESVLAAAAGRLLDDLVDHPLLVGRSYIVERVRDDRVGDPPAFEFRCGLVAVDLLQPSSTRPS